MIDWTTKGDKAHARYVERLAAWKRMGAELEFMGATIVEANPCAIEIAPESLMMVTAEYGALWTCTATSPWTLLTWDRSDGVCVKCHAPPTSEYAVIIAAAIQREARRNT